MTNYQKLTNTQLTKLKSAWTNKTGTILRISKKNFEDKKFPHKLFLKTRQTTKIRNAFADNISTDMKLLCYLWQEKIDFYWEQGT